jgi:hypothetical protein
MRFVLEIPTCGYQGPAECAWDVVKVLEQIQKEALAVSIGFKTVEIEPGSEPGTAHSALILISDGAALESFASSWVGTTSLRSRLRVAQPECVPTRRCEESIEVVEHAMHSSASEWLFLRELRVGTGRQNGGAQRRDAFALNTLPHTAMKRV